MALVFDPFARHQPLRINDDEPDSGGLEIPPANLRISGAPPTPAGPEPDIHLYPQLQALANNVNYRPIAI